MWVVVTLGNAEEEARAVGTPSGRARPAVPPVPRCSGRVALLTGGSVAENGENPRVRGKCR